MELENDSDARRKRPAWEWLVSTAKAEVDNLITTLPKELRLPAERLPIYFEPRPDSKRHSDIEPDTLGLFVGNPLAETHLAHGQPAAHIILFLENIWFGDEEDYKNEIRITYFHELGHYLGLEEDDLEERGL
ncbi:MAG: metallopeptidase family protein [Verrucomicrobiota bacterium]